MKVWINNIYDGLGYKKNDDKYISKHKDKVCTIVHKFANGVYLTDIFDERFINENNDYIHYGFLKLSSQNFKEIED